MTFRSLETRIVVFFGALLAVVLATAFVLVSAANRQIASQEIAQELGVGERVFTLIMEQNGRQLAQAASVLASDFGFRDAIATGDRATILSALSNHGARINAPAVMLIGLDMNVVANTLRPADREMPFPYAGMIATARERRQTSALVLLDEKPHQLVVVPVLAPLPVGWVAMGIPIDDRLAGDISAITSLQVSFLAGERDSAWRLSASTLPPAARGELAAYFGGAGEARAAATSVKLGGETYETRVVTLRQQGSANITVVLQRSLKAALEPFNRLANTLLILAAASLVVSILGSIVIARSLAKPINQLAAVARHIRDGDYTQTVDIAEGGELGELAQSFNHMREAISSREEKILNLAYQDTLTLLPNRALFNERLEAATKAAALGSVSMSMLMMDLDRFKMINDALGHQTGDRVLTEVGARVRALLRKSDTVGRLGGDEFGVILPGADAAQAAEVAKTILRVMEQPIVLDGHSIDVGTSIGIAVYPDHAVDPHAMMALADVAMYVAKRGHKDYAIYDASFDRPREDHLRLAGELRRAVEQNELVLFYQPKLSLRTGATTHVEALVRWQHPTRGLVAPSEFIPFAEQTGSIRMITRWVIRNAIAQCAQWRAAGRDIEVSFNISARDLLSVELPDIVSAELAGRSLDPRHLLVEITESALMDDPALALDTLKRLEASGVGLSIDDYGTGYSSLSYIRKLPVRELKIDRAFVAQMATNAQDAAIVKSTIELAHNLNLKVVAEGVEDAAILQLLRNLGCDMAQGYFMSKPLPAAELERWLAINDPFTIPTVQRALSAAR